MRRDTWIVINQLYSSIINLNSLFCERDDELDKQISTQEQVDEVALNISVRCYHMIIEDALIFLERAKELKSK
jgi:hypothetical protein